MYSGIWLKYYYCGTRHRCFAQRISLLKYPVMNSKVATNLFMYLAGVALTPHIVHLCNVAQSGKKKGKQKKTLANKGLTNTHQMESIAARTQQHVASGLYRLVLALKLADALPTISNCEYDNEKVCMILLALTRVQGLLSHATSKVAGWPILCLDSGYIDLSVHL